MQGETFDDGAATVSLPWLGYHTKGYIGNDFGGIWGDVLQNGWTLYRGSGMLNSVAVVNDSTTTTRDVPGIHVASDVYHIAQPDENGLIPENQVFSAYWGSVSGSLFDPGHRAHFKALTNVPRSMLALTTCKAKTTDVAIGPVYTCAGTAIERISNYGGGRSSLSRGLDRSAPDYLTSKIFARYPRLNLAPSDDPDGRDPPYMGQTLDFKLSRSDFIADCNAATIEVCNKVEEQCQPFLCTQEVKTYKTLVESFGIAFANYGLASAVLMPLFALLAARIGRKPAQAAVSVPQSERKSVSGEV
jgi:hypothetical protein